MRKVPVVLWSTRPPFFRVVRVHQLSVHRFQLWADFVLSRVARCKIEKGGQITDEEVRDKLFGKEDDVCELADLLCPGQRPGFYHSAFPGGLASTLLRPRRAARILKHNHEAMLAAARRAEGPGGWTKIIARLNFSGKPLPVEERGGTEGDAMVVAQLMGLDPLVVLHKWAFLDFLAVCKGLNSVSAERLAAMRPPQAAAPASAAELRRAVKGGRVITRPH